MKKEQLLVAIKQYKEGNVNEGFDFISSFYMPVIDKIAYDFTTKNRSIRGMEFEDLKQILLLDLIRTVGVIKMEYDVCQMDCIFKRNLNFKAIQEYRSQFSQNKKLGKQCNNPILNCDSIFFFVDTESFSGAEKFSSRDSSDSLGSRFSNPVEEKCAEKNLEIFELLHDAKGVLSKEAVEIIELILYGSPIDLHTNHTKNEQTMSTIYKFMVNKRGVSKSKVDNIISREIAPLIQEFYGTRYSKKVPKGQLQKACH